MASSSRRRSNSSGGSFAKLAAADQDAFLQRLEKGDVALDGADGKAFFAQLLQNTLEGFWSDPIYGGNRDMVGWKLIGFPGARYDNTEFVAKHGEKYPLPPVGKASACQSASPDGRHGRACPGHPRLFCCQGVDGRNKCGHDAERLVQANRKIF